jgi:hypothetical protein
MAIAILFYIFTNYVFRMTKPLTYCLFLIGGLLLQAQKFEVVSGSIDNISGIQRYNLVFEYATDLQISKNGSEQAFLKEEYEKREKELLGSGENFKKLWFENRSNLYEPTFVQEFNSFRVADQQVTVAKNISSTAYTMKIKTISITGGYDDFFYVEEGEIGVVISVYQTDTPEIVLYAVETKVRGVANANEFERIRTSYGNLGEAGSKHFSRKALLKK